MVRWRWICSGSVRRPLQGSDDAAMCHVAALAAILHLMPAIGLCHVQQGTTTIVVDGGNYEGL